MKHPSHYRGLKRRATRFLLRHSLLTTRQWRELLLSSDPMPGSHEAFLALYRPSGPVQAMTRQQLEELVARPPTWRDPCPTEPAFRGAYQLAVMGAIGGHESSLGATRDEALQVLRRQLLPLDMATIEVMLHRYDASAPHPTATFGAGWSEQDELGRSREAAALHREEGLTNEEEWLHERRAHLHLRALDSALRVRRRIAFALSIPRRYRELRFRSPQVHAA
jgi:hypothetical protein